MELYTKSVTVAIKSTIPERNRHGAKVTTKSIRIPIIKPRPRPQRRMVPFTDMTNVDSDNCSLSSSDSSTSAIPVSPRTSSYFEDDYAIQRTPSSTRLFFIEDLPPPTPPPIDENDSFGMDSIAREHFLAAFQGFVNVWRMVHS